MLAISIQWKRVHHGLERTDPVRPSMDDPVCHRSLQVGS